jgi:hypothetical protein
MKESPVTKAPPVITPATAMFLSETRQDCMEIDATYQSVTAMEGCKAIIAHAADKALGHLAGTIDSTSHAALKVHALHMTYAYGVNPMLVNMTKGGVTRRAAAIISKALWVQKDEDVHGAAQLMANNLVLDKETVGIVPADMMAKCCLQQASKHGPRNATQLDLVATWAAQNMKLVAQRENMAGLAGDCVKRLSSDRHFKKESDPEADVYIAYYRDLSNAFLRPCVG